MGVSVLDKNKLQKARKALGLTMEQVAEQMTKAGYPTTRSAYCRWETGNVTALKEGNRIGLEIVLKTSYDDLCSPVVIGEAQTV